MKLPSPAACPHPYRVGSSTRSSPHPRIKCRISISYFHLNTRGSETQMSSFYARRNSCQGGESSSRDLKRWRKLMKKYIQAIFLFFFFFCWWIKKSGRKVGGMGTVPLHAHPTLRSAPTHSSKGSKLTSLSQGQKAIHVKKINNIKIKPENSS